MLRVPVVLMFIFEWNNIVCSERNYLVVTCSCQSAFYLFNVNFCSVVHIVIYFLRNDAVISFRMCYHYL